MNRIKHALASVCAMLAGALATAAASAQSMPCPVMTVPPAGTPANEIVQVFPPAAGGGETAWRVRFGHATSKGLYITGAWFRTAPGEPWTRVLWDARLAEIFVPYHPGSPRYYDLTNFSFDLEAATSADAGPCGRIIDGKVVHQVRSYGLMWKDDQAVRYGHELVLWGTLDSANYNYVMSYAFRDDGTIALRLGATSRNLPGSETVAHTHEGLWRIDMDLGGFWNDSALHVTHNASSVSNVSTDSFVAFNGGTEGGIEWNPEEFTEVHVRDTVRTNANGRNISYEFKPVRRGSARHPEAFSHSDFWVTRYRGSERNYSLLPSYVNGESVTDTDVVIWHSSPVHHDPRDEDGRFVGPYWQGVALLMWGGVDIRPRNLFDETPLFP